MDQTNDLIEIENTKNEVIGVQKRGYVHKMNLMHRSVHIALINSRGKMLLQQRASSKDCEPGKRDTSAAGHIDVGEFSLQASERELNEELGLRVTPFDQVFSLSASTETGHEFIDVFLCRSNFTPSPYPVEIIATKWCSTQVLNRWIKKEAGIFTFVFKDIFFQLRKLRVI